MSTLAAISGVVARQAVVVGAENIGAMMQVVFMQKPLPTTKDSAGTGSHRKWPMLENVASPQMQKTATMLAASKMSAAGQQSLAGLRADMEQMLGAMPPPAALAIEPVSILSAEHDPIAARWHRMPASSDAKVILYLHGGGYALGSLDIYKELMARLADKTGASVFGVEYRLAPEHPFPAGLSDAEAAYFWLLEQGVAAEQIAVVGDSAGGGMSLALLLLLRDKAATLPACLILFSPWTDLLATGDSMLAYAESDPMVDVNGIKAMAAYYHNEAELNHALVSPMYGQFKGLPPILVQVGENEVLLDDSVRLKPLADEAGVSLELQVFAGAFHVFQIFPAIPETSAALDNVDAFLARHIKA